jgi:hypothetical protein
LTDRIGGPMLAAAYGEEEKEARGFRGLAAIVGL